MKVCELLQTLINISEKGANIARIIRSESSLLELLVQEKKGNQKNERFVQDFKTLVDVLVQELVRYDLSQKFPGISESIYGEESNKFTNTLGDTVTVNIQHTQEQTRALLSTILDDNETASDILAQVIHEDVNVVDTESIDHLHQEIPVDSVGVWIDPIDSTAQYIHGEVGVQTDGLVSEGLQCVSVLIGVYDKQSGLPIIGLINQPFSTQQIDGSWTGDCTWGVCMNDVRANSLSDNQSGKTARSRTAHTQNTKPIILISASESQTVQDVLSKSFDLRHTSGAGYKLLGVCQGLADAYVLSHSSNYKWDCCGPHAILRSLGGGIVNYTNALTTMKITKILKASSDSGSACPRVNITGSEFKEVKYHVSDKPECSGAQRWCNDGGIIAYTSLDMLLLIANAVAEIKTK